MKIRVFFEISCGKCASKNQDKNTCWKSNLKNRLKNGLESSCSKSAFKIIAKIRVETPCWNSVFKIHVRNHLVKVRVENPLMKLCVVNPAENPPKIGVKNFVENLFLKSVMKIFVENLCFKNPCWKSLLITRVENLRRKSGSKILVEMKMHVKNQCWKSVLKIQVETPCGKFVSKIRVKILVKKPRWKSCFNYVLEIDAEYPFKKNRA